MEDRTVQYEKPNKNQENQIFNFSIIKIRGSFLY